MSGLTYNISAMSITKDAEQVDGGGLHLLNLPAEIRILIYREALVSDEAIDIDTTNRRVPGLLQINRQIRQEARPLYFLENTFDIACPNFDATALFAFHKQSSGINFSDNDYDRPFDIFVGKKPRDWKNLVHWIRAVYRDPSMPYEIHGTKVDAGKVWDSCTQRDPAATERRAAGECRTREWRNGIPRATAAHVDAS